MRRARLIFDRLLEQDHQLRAMLRGGEAPQLQRIRVETLSVYQEPFEPGEWITELHGIRVTLLEFVKWLYYAHVWKPQMQQPAPVDPQPTPSS